MDSKIKILTLLILIGGDAIAQKAFVSPMGLFELNYPEHWIQVEEKNNTYLFLDNDKWKGNLRITAMSLDHEDNEPQS